MMSSSVCSDSLLVISDDYRLATHTIATLQLAKKQDRPFFVMAGFRRPHRDFLVHQQYWDMYRKFTSSLPLPLPLPVSCGAVFDTLLVTSADASEIATAVHPVRDKSQPLIAFHPAGFVLPNGTNYPGDPDKAWPVEIQQIARKAYYTA